MMRLPGVLLLLLGCSCVSPVAPSPEVSPVPKPSTTRAAAAASAPDAQVPSLGLKEVEHLDMDLLRRVDEAIQGRFAVVREEDIRRGRLGASRVVTLRPAGHRRVFEPEADSEREMLAKLYSAGWRGVVYVAGDSNFVGPITLGKESPPRAGQIRTVKALAAQCLERGTSVAAADGAVCLEARPVLASQEQCLRCHANKQLGDPIGAVVYAFSKDRPWIATGSGE